MAHSSRQVVGAFSQGAYEAMLKALQQAGYPVKDKWFGELEAFIEAAKGRSFVVGYGTARDQCVTASDKAFIDALTKAMVERGFCLSNGGSSTGAMGALSVAMEQAHSNAVDSESALFLVYLLFNAAQGSEAPYKPRNGLPLHHVHITDLGLRRQIFGLLEMVADVKAHVTFAGGFGTLDEISGWSIATQLRKVGYTYYAEGNPTPLVIVDSLLPSGRWLYQPILEQWSTMAELGTITPATLGRTKVLRFDQPQLTTQGDIPENLAEYITAHYVTPDEGVGLVLGDSLG